MFLFIAVVSHFLFHPALLGCSIGMAKQKSRLQTLRESIRSLLDEGTFRSADEPSRLYKFAHFWVLVWKSFVRNRCPIRASALSFTTLLALIPLLAVAISVTGGLLKKEGEEEIYRFIDNFVSTIVPPAIVTNAPPVSSDTSLTVIDELINTNADSRTFEKAQTNQAAAVSITTNAPSGERIAVQKEAAQSIHSFIQNIRGGTLGCSG